MSNLSDKPWLIPGHMYQYDIGWLVDKLLSFETELNTAIDLKTIHYADPIQWDITTQYSPNTVVVDPKTGTAYMSKVPVPSGVLLTNTDYWVVIFNYQRVYDKIMSGVAFNDRDNLNATKDLLVNDLVWYGGDLYRATREIPRGTTYIPGTNLTPTTIADCLATYYGRDRVAQVLNDTVNVSGDYTLNAGDIAETASNVTIHSTRDMLLDADGNMTEQVTGEKTSEISGKLTEIVTGSREIDVGGDTTENFTGQLEINVGGDATENFSGEHIVNGNNESNTYTGDVTNIANKFIFTSKEKNFPINFPDKSLDLYNLKLTPEYLFTPSNPNNIADELNELLKITSVSLSTGNYTITKPIVIPVGKTLNGNDSIINKSFTDYGVVIGNDPTLGDTNYGITGMYHITINCNNVGSGILINSKRCNLQNIKIRNSATSGIDIFKPEYSGSPSDCQINNIDIIKDDGSTYSTYGMRIYGSDNNISNVRTLFTKVGFYISDRGSSTYFTDCHPLAFSSEIDGWLDSIGWDDYSNNTFISNCYADNFCTCYKVNKPNSMLSICNLKYFCWEYNRQAVRTFLSLYSGCFVNAIGLDVPVNSTIRKVDFPDGYFYLGNDRINLSFVNPNEPSAFNENDFGNLSLYRFYNKYFKEFNNDPNTFHLVGVCKLLRQDMMCSSITIIADEFAINGLTVSKAGTINKGNGTDTDLTVEIRKSASDLDTNTIYIYVKYSGYFGRCLCEVSNNFLMLPRLYEPSTEPNYILSTINYKISQ